MTFASGGGGRSMTFASKGGGWRSCPGGWWSCPGGAVLTRGWVVVQSRGEVDVPPAGQTDACENITFARFATRAVTIVIKVTKHVYYRGHTDSVVC